MVWTPRKTVGAVYHKIGRHEKMTGEIRIANTDVSLGCFGYFGNSIGQTLEIEAFGFLSFKNYLTDWVTNYNFDWD